MFKKEYIEEVKRLAKEYLDKNQIYGYSLEIPKVINNNSLVLTSPNELKKIYKLDRYYRIYKEKRVSVNKSVENFFDKITNDAYSLEEYRKNYQDILE